MTSAPIIEMIDVVKDHGGPSPLHITRLVVSADTRMAVSGLDAAEAETVVHLVSGAALPDRGRVLVAGTDTQTITTDTEWLKSLDRFGVVTARAVLLDSLPVAANIALPLTLAIEPMSAETRRDVEALADLVGLDRARLDDPVSAVNPLTRAQLHLARAFAGSPTLILLEHPTAAFAGSEPARTFGRWLEAASNARSVGWVAFSDDQTFIKASGGEARRLDPATGVLGGSRWRWPWS